jgi:nitrite reductase/ring-hydroxylating ferredoxin subunit
VIEVGRLTDFAERSVKLVSIGRLELGIVRWDGDRVYALRNLCPHAGGPVCQGRLGPKIIATGTGPFALEVDESCPTLTCAWHGWEFDARDGRAVLAGSRLAVRTYPVRVQDGAVLVDIGDRERP